MTRSKTKKLRPSSSTTTTRSTPKKRNANNQSQDCKEEEEDKEEEALLPLVTTSITETLRFLSSSDLQLTPSSVLSLSSLLSLSSRSLASLLSLLSLSAPLPLLPPPPRSPSTPPFSWFRRFLASSTSPSDPRWLDNFRMSKPSFYLLLSSLSPSLLSLHSSPSPFPPDLKLASALFRLAHAAPFPFLARRFGLSDPSLAARAFYEVLRALSLSLSHLFELATDAPRILQGFTWMSLPNCCGALGYCRFHADGVFGSVIAQCLVDSEGRFLDVSVGWHGSMDPAHILAKTKLFGAQSAILDDGKYFIGGPCCPLLPWLLTPYNTNTNTNNSSSNECAFNTVHARGMELVERAFRRLKGRWKLLRMEWKEECVEALPYVVVGCCLLHNYLIKCSEPVVEEGEGDAGKKEEMGFKEFEGKGDEGGERMRDAIASQLSQVFHK